MANKDSSLSRRNVVIGLAVAGAAGGSTVAVPLFTDAATLENILRPVGLGRRNVKLGSATSADWALQKDTTFTAQTGHVLKLVDVQVYQEKSARPAGLRDKAFIARFDIIRGGPLEGNRTYRFNHSEGGVFDMFLSARNPGNPLRMNAIFN